MTPKRPRDPNQLAKSIIDIARRGRSLTATPRQQGKDPAAVRRGQLGGAKGGKGAGGQPDEGPPRGHRSEGR